MSNKSINTEEKTETFERIHKTLCESKKNHECLVTYERMTELKERLRELLSKS